MGSKSDWETMKHTCDILDELEVPYEKKVVSAHRTPDFMFEYAEQAQETRNRSHYCRSRWSGTSSGNGCSKNIASRHWCTSSIKSVKWNGFLLSIVQMPGGVPVATMAIGKAGAVNAGLTCSTNVRRP